MILKGREETFFSTTAQEKSPSIPDSQDALLVLFIWAQIQEDQDSTLFPPLKKNVFYLLYHSSLFGSTSIKQRPSLDGSQRAPSRKDGDWERASFTGRAKKRRRGGVLEELTEMLGTTQEIKKT